MSPMKEGCRYLPCCPEKSRPDGDRPDWEMHPSWAAGMEALRDYHCWVDEVVLPIAFQWIEEHKSDVYRKVPDALKDDVGVVIAAAFGIVKELPPYKEGLEKCKSYEAAGPGGIRNPESINPVWSRITKKIRKDTKEAFAEESAVLGDTIP